MSKAKPNFLTDLQKSLLAMISSVRNQFGIGKNEAITRLIPNLCDNAKENRIDLVIYVSNWVEKALSGIKKYGKGVIMLGRDSALA